MPGRRGAEGSWERDPTLQHGQWVGGRPAPLPVLRCPALPGEFFKPLVLKDTGGPHSAQDRQKAGQGMMEVAGRFLGGWLEQVTTWLQIKFKYHFLFSAFVKIYLKSTNVSGTRHL